MTTVTPKQEEAFRGELLSEEGVMGKMSAHVSRDAKYDKVVEYLLGRYLLVDTLDHAMSISKKYHYSVRMVTLDGELLNPGGSMSGGAFCNNSNLLGRKREMDSLQQQVEKRKEELDKVRQSIQDTNKEVEHCVQEAAEKGELLRKLEVKKNTAAIKYEQAVETKEQKDKEYLHIAQDGKEIEDQKVMLESTLGQIERDLSGAKDIRAQAENRIKELSAQLESDHDKQAKLQDELASVRMDVSAFQQKNNYISENIQRITTGIQELKASYEKFVQEQEDSDGAVEQMQQAIQGLGEKSKELEQEIQVLLQEIDESVRRKKK